MKPQGPTVKQDQPHLEAWTLSSC